ncbi:hypothetical protein XAC3810_900009 [Xanthomonas citri pv. citri]|uniref:Uncharacterized protein n=1 Tax=Xanthomonas citri pv. citri TaxID=611301 RepID=A0A0U4YJ28_XANCI|nr:hypothetical protein XAC3810_900009 [Xanthomonas citri pv. citri]CEE56288.1 hypothetical protein XAC2852_1220001 [Xanthomonas citri pv. citri]CEE82020.1 hypothetical protein XACW160_910010 [Xanthomonas citri pv. citri]CEG15276.1 hypothetical protein XAC3562_1800009 [Xanthomonas citri pv. citri]CEH48134.1 hypothetical protein XAC3610_11340001 [Xanthomonas citri pv. citri]
MARERPETAAEAVFRMGWLLPHQLYRRMRQRAAQGATLNLSCRCFQAGRVAPHHSPPPLASEGSESPSVVRGAGGRGSADIRVKIAHKIGFHPIASVS